MDHIQTTETPASTDRLGFENAEMPPEELGRGMAIACQAWIKENDADECMHADHGVHFRSELNALVFVCHRISIEIFGPDDKPVRNRICAGFDWYAGANFNDQFIELTDLRGPYYYDCIRENWNSKYFAFRLATLFDQFCLGRDPRKQGPLIVGDYDQSIHRGMTAVNALKAVFNTCSQLLQEIRIAV